MECSRAKELLSDYLDGIMDTPSAKALEAHLVGCNGCRQELDALKALISELNRMEPVRAPDDFLDQIHERLKPRRRFDKIIKKLFFPPRIKISLELATAAVMAVLIFAVISTQQPERHFIRDSEPSISSPILERAADPYGASSELIKSKPDMNQTTPNRLEKEIQPIRLAVVVKIGESGSVTETMEYQDAASEPAPGMAIGVMGTESQSVTSFSEKRSRPQTPVAESAEKFVPARSPRQATPLRKDEQKVKEKILLNLSETLQRLIKIIQSLEGSVLSESDSEQSQSLKMVTVSIPARRYNEFVEELKQMAPFRTPPPYHPASDQDSIHMQIRFIVSE